MLYYDGQALSAAGVSDPDSFVQLQNSSGVTYSDGRHRFGMGCLRDVGLGYEVLLDGAGKKEGKASIWTVGSDGVIDSSSGWFSGTDDFWSWEGIWVDLDNDGEIGNPNTEGMERCLLMGMGFIGCMTLIRANTTC